ncbi:MAG: hypothetical protein AVDCRST_MAG02-692 [uncultured Rubrobacteraceae bacterium]|uniref:Uncharacterized protein n=1 Tax=uncultured Rubrobacteraceae bacterium TaxID=349277 RepID=A0A6J4QQ30_9ACTN|nr:MAG: hypothetical protein AVDCRST_MAG02-692 [uncultured Rubrobacteraceae bacterium]
MPGQRRRGRGAGTETTRLMPDYAFTAPGLHNVTLTVFEEIGHRREYRLLGGRLYDEIYMDCLATEFEGTVTPAKSGASPPGRLRRHGADRGRDRTRDGTPRKRPPGSRLLSARRRSALVPCERDLGVGCRHSTDRPGGSRAASREDLDRQEGGGAPAAPPPYENS